MESPTRATFNKNDDIMGKNKSMVNYLEEILNNPVKQATINIIDQTSIDIQQIKQETNRSQRLSTRGKKATNGSIFTPRTPGHNLI